MHVNLNNIKHILYYYASLLSTKIRFKMSGIVVRIHTDASYFYAPKARSRSVAYIYLKIRK